jgi:hypothetical protein
VPDSSSSSGSEDAKFPRSDAISETHSLTCCTTSPFLVSPKLKQF